MCESIKQARPVLFSLLTACGAAAPSPVRPTPFAAPVDNRVVSGQRIGPIALGMTAAEVLDRMGPPVRGFPDGANSVANWPKLEAYFFKSEWVYQVITQDETYVTPEGIHVGTSEFEVTTRLGKPWRSIDRSLRGAIVNGNPDKHYEFCYESGTGLTFDNLDKVSTITVYIPGKCFGE
jgi:hypothetical protein